MYNVFQEDINAHIFHCFLPPSFNWTLEPQHRAWWGIKLTHLVMPITRTLGTRVIDITFNLSLLMRKCFNPVRTGQTWNHLINLICFWFFKSFTQKKLAPQSNHTYPTPNHEPREQSFSHIGLETGDLNGFSVSFWKHLWNILMAFQVFSYHTISLRIYSWKDLFSNNSVFCSKFKSLNLVTFPKVSVIKDRFL